MEEEVDFGFLFCKVCHFYSMTDTGVLAMPVRRFWMMLGNINRVSAEREMRSLRIGTVAAQGNNEMHEECRKALVIEMGEVVKVPHTEEEFDEEGWSFLKSLR